MNSNTQSSTDLEQLLSQIAPTQASDSNIRIQIGRTVCYKGTVDQAQTNTLSEAQIADLTTALSQQTGEASPLASTISITLNGEPFYRSSPKAGVTLNQAVPSVQMQSIDSNDPVTPSPAVVLESLESAVAAMEPAVEPAIDTLNAPSPAPKAEPDQDGLSALEVMLLEMSEPDLRTPPQTMQWLYNQFQEVAQSQLAQSIQKEGTQWTRNALNQVAKLSQATIERGVADSLVALTKQFGSVQDSSDGKGSKQFRYDAEAYSVTVRGTNHYTLSDQEGKTLFAFRHSPTAIQVTSPCQLGLSQRFEIMQAGAALVKSQVKDATRSGIGGLQTLASSLAQLAPQGTRDRIVALQQQQAVAVSEALVNTRQAVATAGGRMFSGSHLKVFKTPEALRVFATDGRGELLTKVGNAVKSRMNDLDLAQVSQSAQMLANAFRGKEAATKQEPRSKSGSGR